jgi:hypothetical protein
VPPFPLVPATAPFVLLRLFAADDARVVAMVWSGDQWVIAEPLPNSGSGGSLYSGEVKARFKFPFCFIPVACL